MALDPGRGSTAVPTRTTIAGAVIAIAATATAFTFVASLDRLVETPALYGQTWDVQFGDGFSPDVADEVYPIARDSEYVAAFAGGALDEGDVGGTRVGLLALEPVEGTIEPALVDGRAPLADDEVLLDPRTLDDIDAAIGDEVEVTVRPDTTRMRVVGSGVLTGCRGGTAPAWKRGDADV